MVENPVPGAKKIKVPWILQDVFPAYHGVVWYWHDFLSPKNVYPSGRTLLRFESIDYMGEVWLNDVYMGRYESGMLFCHRCYGCHPIRENQSFKR